MKKITLLLLLLTAGCAQRPVTDYNPERNFFALHNYAWSEKSSGTGQDKAINNTLTDQRIRESVDETLSEQNFQKVDAAKADFLVTYHITVKETLNPSSSVGVGFGGFNPGFMLGGSVAVSQYQETQLSVDILDPHSSDLIWRGSLEYPTQNALSPSQRAEEIHKKVSIILSAFPPQ